MTTPPTPLTLEHAYNRFEEAYGHLCDVTAKALEEGRDREMVERAFRGQGRAFKEILAARRHVTERVELVKHHGMKAGLQRTCHMEMIRLARLVKDAAEAEWMVSIPITDPNP
jgi:hypothetical protein